MRRLPMRVPVSASRNLHTIASRSFPELTETCVGATAGFATAKLPNVRIAPVANSAIVLIRKCFSPPGQRCKLERDLSSRISRNHPRTGLLTCKWRGSRSFDEDSTLCCECGESRAQTVIDPPAHSVDEFSNLACVQTADHHFDGSDIARMHGECPKA